MFLFNLRPSAGDRAKKGPCGKIPARSVFMRIAYCISLMAACAAARRAMGTRNGEQLT